MAQYLTGTSVMVADGVMLFIAYTLVAIRLWFRLLHQRMSLTISDIFLLIASIELLAIFCILIKDNDMGAIQEDFKFTPTLLKLSFASVLLYDSALYFLKFSILTMYSSIFPTGKSKLRHALYFAMTLTAMFALTAPLMAIFWCGTRVERNWSLTSNCSFWNKDLFMADWVMNMISDIMILLLPFPLLAKLKLSRRQIVGLSVTFGLGTITIVVSTLRFTTFMKHAFVPLYVWSVAEISTGIMVVSLPALRPLLRKAGTVVTSTAIARRRSSWPMQSLPPSVEGEPSFRMSKSEHRYRYGEPPDGYHYTYDEERSGSDVELHGGLKSDVGSNAETIAVYADATEVLEHERVRPEDAQRRARNAKAWVQNTRQLK